MIFKDVKEIRIPEGKVKQIAKGNDVLWLGARLSYSGDYEGPVSIQMDDGTLYELYTLKSSGILNLSSDALFWMCGGGAGGLLNELNEKFATGYSGSGGGGGYVLSGSLDACKVAVVIGAGGTADTAGSETSIGELRAEGGGLGFYGVHNAQGLVDGGHGGSGGGGGCNSAGSAGVYRGYGGNGGGVTTIPFKSMGYDIMSDPHCAGGGGGEYQKSGHSPSSGGNGGSNGSAGLSYGHNSEGGTKGGGAGGKCGYIGAASGGGSATFYGSGGGGAPSGGNAVRAAGSGYQGVVYILMAA